MVIERNANNTIVVMARETLTPSYWLLHFNDPDRNGNAYCVVQAENTTGAFLTLTFTEVPSGAVATSGEVTLSPAGNWTLTIYEQTSPTNVDVTLAGRQVKTVAIYVDPGTTAETGWTDECPTAPGACTIDVVVNVDGTQVQTLDDLNPCEAQTYNISITYS
jgi:hypothetical protein